MADGYAGLIEMIFSFGVVLLWGGYQLWSLRRGRSKSDSGKSDERGKGTQ